MLLAQRVEVLGRDGRLPGVIGKKHGPFKKDTKMTMKFDGNDKLTLTGPDGEGKLTRIK